MLSEAASISLASVSFLTNGTDLSATSCGSVDLDTCILTGNTAGISANVTGMVTVSGCTITGSGSGYGLSVVSSGSEGGLHLNGSTVSGRVAMSGKGLAEIVGNPSLGSVELSSNLNGQTLRSVVRLNQVQGAIYLLSQPGVQGQTTYHEAEVYGNRSSQLKFLAQSNSNWSYMTAVADSNVITASGTDAVWIWSGMKDSQNSPYNGYTDLTLRRNVLTGGTSGVTAIVEAGAGYVVLRGEDNVITGAGVGERFTCGTQIRASLSRESITGCGTGLTSTGGVLSFSDCELTGSPQSDWAISISGADSVSCQSALIDNWANGISLNSCAWSKIADNDLRGRQQGFGIKCVASSPLILDNYVDHYLTAIQAESNATPLVSNNSLSCAVVWGLNNLSPGATIDARENWWGGSSGPYNHDGNPGGEGSPVSSDVLFSPWLSGYPNRPPMPFDLVSPGNGAVVDSIPVFDWSDARDPDCHDVLTYTLYLSPDSAFADSRVIDGISESRFVVPDSLFFAIHTPYYWKVKVTDHTKQDSAWCNRPYWTFTYPTISDAGRDAARLPREWRLAGAWPNPFSGEARIRFEVPAAALVRLEIFDVGGRLIRVLCSQRTETGVHHIRWDGRDANGSTMGPGVYFCRMTGGRFHASTKLVMR